MRNLKKIASILLAVCMMLTLVACGAAPASTSSPSASPAASESASPAASESAAPAVDTSQRVDLVFYVMGDPPKDETVVEDAINAKLLEKVNATVDFQFSTWTDWAQKYNLELTSGQADMIYVANWNNYGTLANSGAFLALDDLFPNYAPDAAKIIDESLLNQCKVNGKLYAIPNNWPEYTPNGVKYREDLRVKYNLPVPNTLENFEAYLLGIQKNDPKQGLLTVTTAESSGLQTAFDAFQIFNIKYPWVTTNGLPYGLAANYETPGDVYDYWGSQDFVNDCKLMKKWADLGFWSKSALSDPNNSDSYVNGLCVAEIAGQNPNKNITAVTSFEQNHPDWKSEYIAYGEVTGALYPAAATQNATAIVNTCKNPERAMMVFNLLFTDKELNNLVQCGIKGTHYELTADGYYKNLNPTSPTFAYEGFNTWNLRNNDLKLPQESDKLLNQYFSKYGELVKKNKWQGVNIYGNFTEDYSAYQTERGAVSDVMRQYLAPIQAGFVTDVDAAIKDFLKRANDAGLQTCRDGFTEQYKAYITEHGYDK